MRHEDGEGLGYIERLGPVRWEVGRGVGRGESRVALALPGLVPTPGGGVGPARGAGGERARVEGRGRRTGGRATGPTVAE